MTTEPHKKTPRSFHCRDALWQKFEQMAKELECSVDYLINDAMKQYVRQRGYAGPGSTLTNMAAVNPGSVPPPAAPNTTAPPPLPPAAAAPPPPPPPPAAAPKQPPAPPAAAGKVAGTTTGSHAGPPPPAPHLPPTTSGSQAGHLPKPPPAPPPPARAFPPPPVTGGGAPMSQAAVATQRVPPLGTSPGSRNVPPPRQAPPPLPAPAATAAPPATSATRTLSVRYEGQVFPITKDRFVIGRGKNASDLTIKDPNVSRQHALVEFSNGQYYIVDMGSTNGVEFKGSKVQRKVIDDGDTVRVCEHELTFSFSG